jgi:hypothetical protein
MQTKVKTYLCLGLAGKKSLAKPVDFLSKEQRECFEYRRRVRRQG